MSWVQDEHDDIAAAIENIRFKCACDSTIITLSSLECKDVIAWLKYKTPIYHMGMFGCCEKLRCKHCDEFPGHCECLPGAYEPWGDDE